MWKAVKNYEGIYEVNEDGHVKALKRTWFSGRYGKIRKEKDEHIMKSMLKKNGYLKVTLVKNGIQETVNIHRIVAEAFIENPENKPEVNHKNGKKCDNHVSNLEWATYSENTIHAYKTGLFIAARRGNHSQAKKIKCTTLDLQFDCINDASDILGIGETSIGRVCNGKQIHTSGLVFKFI